MKQFIDLSYPIEPGMPSLPFPHHALTEFSVTGRIKMEGSRAHRVSFGTHTGTHIDSPSHMLEDKRPFVDEIPLERLIGPAKLLRLNKDKNDNITQQELSTAALEHGDRLLICTGWGKKWGGKDFYFDYPIFTPEAVDYLIERKISLLGIDTPSPDRLGLAAGDPMKNYVHKACFKNDILLLEALANLETLPANQFELIVLPLAAKGLDGFPVRAVAVCEL